MNQAPDDASSSWADQELACHTRQLEQEQEPLVGSTSRTKVRIPTLQVSRVAVDDSAAAPDKSRSVRSAWAMTPRSSRGSAVGLTARCAGGADLELIGETTRTLEVLLTRRVWRLSVHRDAATKGFVFRAIDNQAEPARCYLPRDEADRRARPQSATSITPVHECALCDEDVAALVRDCAGPDALAGRSLGEGARLLLDRLALKPEETCDAGSQTGRPRRRRSGGLVLSFEGSSEGRSAGSGLSSGPARGLRRWRYMRCSRRVGGALYVIEAMADEPADHSLERLVGPDLRRESPALSPTEAKDDGAADDGDDGSDGDGDESALASQPAGSACVVLRFRLYDPSASTYLEAAAPLRLAPLLADRRRQVHSALSRLDVLQTRDGLAAILRLDRPCVHALGAADARGSGGRSDPKGARLLRDATPETHDSPKVSRAESEQVQVGAEGAGERCCADIVVSLPCAPRDSAAGSAVGSDLCGGGRQGEAVAVTLAVGFTSSDSGPDSRGLPLLFVQAIPATIAAAARGIPRAPAVNTNRNRFRDGPHEIRPEALQGPALLLPLVPLPPVGTRFLQPPVMMVGMGEAAGEAAGEAWGGLRGVIAGLRCERLVAPVSDAARGDGGLSTQRGDKAEQSVPAQWEHAWLLWHASEASDVKMSRLSRRVKRARELDAAVEKFISTSQPPRAPKAEPKAVPQAEPTAQPKAEPQAEPQAEPKAEPKALRMAPGDKDSKAKNRPRPGSKDDDEDDHGNDDGDAVHVMRREAKDAGDHEVLVFRRAVLLGGAHRIVSLFASPGVLRVDAHDPSDCLSLGLELPHFPVAPLLRMARDQAEGRAESQTGGYTGGHAGGQTGGYTGGHAGELSLRRNAHGPPAQALSAQALCASLCRRLRVVDGALAASNFDRAGEAAAAEAREGFLQLVDDASEGAASDGLAARRGAVCALLDGLAMTTRRRGGGPGWLAAAAVILRQRAPQLGRDESGPVVGFDEFLEALDDAWANH